MPFIQRVVEPKFISRSIKLEQSKQQTDEAGPSSSSALPISIKDNEMEAITNITLCNALRQLASLLAISKEIFEDLNIELQSVADRSQRIKQKISVLHVKVDKFDPKLVAVRK